MKREIKFRIIYKGKVHGYERLTEKNGAIFWEWMSFDTNGEGRENWYRGTFPNGFMYERNQFTGLKDKNGVDIYENDPVKLHDHPTGFNDCTTQVVFKDGAFVADDNGIRISDYGTAWIEVLTLDTSMKQQ